MPWMLAPVDLDLLSPLSRVFTARGLVRASGGSPAALMPAIVALLRAVNVGGANRLAMPALRAALEQNGFTDVRMLLQSGNVVCRSSLRTATAIERRICQLLREHCAVDVDVMVRTAAEWRAIVSGNPFRVETERDPAHVVVMAFGASVSAEATARLQASIKGRERLLVAGTHAYIVYPDGIGTSRLTAAIIERVLGTRGTARNWNTVLKLQGLLDEADEAQSRSRRPDANA
jgi:uncharacterized protein (DUF1697 family)